MTILKSNSRLLNRKKTSHAELENQRNAALAELRHYGPTDRHGLVWLARVDEAISRRAAGHLEYLRAVAAYRRRDGIAGAEYFEARAAEIAALVGKQEGQ